MKRAVATRGQIGKHLTLNRFQKRVNPVESFVDAAGD